MFETIGPVWDGNEVWLVVAGGATFAAFPAWYATMFSGFYIALLLVLFFLIVRVVSFEWREKSESPRWRAVWLWANAIGSFGASLIWGVGLANLLYGVPLNSSGDFAGDFGDLFSALHRGRRPRGRAPLRASTGPTFLTLRTTGDLCERARPRRAAARPAGGARGRGLPRLDGRRRRRPERQGRLPTRSPGRARHRRARPRRRPRLPAQERLGLRDDRRRRRARGGDALHEPLSARHGLQPGLRNSLTVDNAVLRALHAGGDERRGADPPSVVLLYQGWTYYVFRARVTGEEHRAARRRAPRPAASPQVRHVRALDPRLSVARGRPAPARRRRRHSASATALLVLPRPRSSPDRRPRVRRRLAGRSSCRRLARAVFAVRGASRGGSRPPGGARPRRPLELRLAWSSGGSAASRPRSTAPRARRSRGGRPGRRRARGDFARYLPQVVLASVVPVSVLVWSRRSTSTRPRSCC